MSGKLRVAHFSLEVSEQVVHQIYPNNCVKPPVGFRGYHLQWSHLSPGIPENETVKLRTFFRNIVPHLKKMTQASQEIQTYSEKERNLGAIDLNIHVFCPFVHLSCGLGVTYDVSTTWDGVFFIDRTEEIYLKKGNDELDSERSSFLIKSEIGEIVEDRVISFTPEFLRKLDIPPSSTENWV